MKACLQMQPEFCSREKPLYYFKRQQNEKPTSNETVFTLTFLSGVVIIIVLGVSVSTLHVCIASGHVEDASDIMHGIHVHKLPPSVPIKYIACMRNVNIID